MTRRIAFLTMFVLFALAYVALDNLPRAAASALRSGSDDIELCDESMDAAAQG